MLETIVLQYWPLVVVGVGFGVWIVRLEARSVRNEREIERLWSQRKEDLANAQHSRDEQSKKLDDIQNDIKKLLGRVYDGTHKA